MTAYCHVYNRGIEGREIFKDQEDYDTFLGYLKEYLSPAPHPQELKKQFIVKGRTYHGLPHQPKNYFGQIELVAYSLVSDQFHLLINETQKGAQTKFLRSICTRYSMYYNKKYSRRGALYEGPYKSVAIIDASELPRYVRLMHAHESGSGQGVNSRAVYNSSTKMPWIQPEHVLSRAPHFKEFSEDIKAINEDRQNLAEGLFTRNTVIPQAKKDTLERSDHVSAVPQPQPKSNPTFKLPEFVAASLGIFVVLLALGLRNVNISLATKEAAVAAYKDLTQAFEPSTPSVSGASDTIESAEAPVDEQLTVDQLLEALEKKTYIEINSKTNQLVNIRLAPTIESEIVQTATNGDTFEYVETVEGWHRIKLQDGLAFVSENDADLIITP